MYTDDSGAIAAILQGDRDRYEELVRKYKRMVYGIAWSHLGDRDLSEDVAQETFVTAFRHLGTLRSHNHFPGWLAQIARNVCNTFGRKAQRERTLAERWILESDADQARDDDRRSLEEQLHDAFAELPAIHREALTIFYLEEKSIRESAEILGVSETALKARLHRARTALREQLERRLEDTFESLEPSRGFDQSVLAALPLMPNGVLGTGGIAAGIGKFVSGLGFMLWMILVQIGVVAAILAWFVKSEAANIKDTPENQFRKAVLKRMMILIGVIAVISGLAGQLLMASFEIRTFFRLLALFMVPFAWRMWRSLRVNNTPAMLGSVFMVAAYLLSAVAIGFLNAPIWSIIAAVPIVNIVIFLSSRNRPARQDYNLFLRAATGGLGEVPEHEPPLPGQLTQEQFRAFARFLGNQWLVSGYSMQGSSIHMVLTSAGPTIQAILGLGSSVALTVDGTCTARLHPADLKMIRQTTGSHPIADDLQTTICRVVRYALSCFLQGDTEEARSVLTARNDEAIFRQRTGWTKPFRVMFALTIVSSILMAVAFLLASLGR